FDVFSSKNKLQSLDDIGFNTAITFINVSENQFTKIPSLPKLKDLTGLNLFFSFKNAFVVLNLANNQIKIIENLQHYPNLKAFMLNGNQIMRMQGLDPLKELTTLGTLFDCSYFHIKHLSSIVQQSTRRNPRSRQVGQSKKAISIRK